MNKNKLILILGVLAIAGTVAFLYSTKYTDQIPTVSMGEYSDSNTTERPTPEPVKNESFATTTQSGIIDEHLTVDDTLRIVDFCGTTYQTKQVFIDGVDVVQRIAKIVSNNESAQKELLNKAICANSTYGKHSDDELEVSFSVSPSTGAQIYYIGIGQWVIFTINYQDLQITISKDGEGDSILLGTLK